MRSLARKADQAWNPGKTESAILHALLYFDVFHFPLKASELLEYANSGCRDLPEMINTLARMKHEGLVKQQGELYTVSDEPGLFERRLRGNNEAVRYLRIAKRISGFIARFPFVRGVMISGSLSKGFMDQKSDIDFFIITEKGRLWISRSMLAAFRKMLPARWKKYFCINYFIDTTQLEIPEKNLFTATEIAFIHPVYNPALYEAFMAANGWVSSNFYPNKSTVPTSSCLRQNRFLPRVILEKLFFGSLGDRIDNKLHRFMKARWEKRFSQGHIREEFELNFRTRKNASKHHQHGHQAKILSLYRQNILDFEARHGVLLPE
jgi:hypothetical protein